MVCNLLNIMKTKTLGNILAPTYVFLYLMFLKQSDGFLHNLIL